MAFALATAGPGIFLYADLSHDPIETQGTACLETRPRPEYSGPKMSERQR